MAKTFYTERDIVELGERGATSLEVNDDVVVTDAARDEALKRGMRLVRSAGEQAEDQDQAELIHRVKAAVIARLGDQVDSAMLNAVVTRVVKGMK